MSRGRPCDYSGMSYAKLTGSSGIQWPCNKEYPEGKERLFNDNVFFTDIECTESFGHDMETGVPLSRAKYMTMNPAGRAILKTAEYIPALEECNDDFSLRLSTGRRVYHFHTRTKTGRSKELQAKASETKVELNAEDAEKYGIKDGDEVVIKSRRGAIQVPATISKIVKGQIFIPFHYGYWDKAKGSAASAANELIFSISTSSPVPGSLTDHTLVEQWDPISKQPMFKSGAVSVTKTPTTSSSLETPVSIPEQQSAAISSVETSKPNAAAIKEKVPLQRHLPYWLNSTAESITVLVDIFTRILPTLITDKEMHAGILVLRSVASEMSIHLSPSVSKYASDDGIGSSSATNNNQDPNAANAAKYKTHGRWVSAELRDMLFPAVWHQHLGSYETLATLQALKMYYSHVERHLLALGPASQALLDRDFLSAVQYCTEQLERLVARADFHLKVKSPQILLVPDAEFLGPGSEEERIRGDGGDRDGL